MNKLLEKFEKGEPSIGTFAQLNSAQVVECLGRTGLDYVLIDTEHCMAYPGVVSASITAADAAGLTPLVRINEITRSVVLQALDYGAKGLIIPAVETVEQVQKLVKFAKFQPPETAAGVMTKYRCKGRRHILRSATGRRC